MKNLLFSNKGVVLLLALILGLVSIGLTLALFSLISTGTKISGKERVYTASIEAVKGASLLLQKFLTREVDEFTMNGTQQSSCLMEKRSKSTDEWSDNCTTSESDLRISIGDLYNVSFRIVDTKVFHVTIPDYSGTPTTERAYLYTVEAEALFTLEEREKSRVTFIYKVVPE